MHIEEALYAHLTGDAGVAAAFGTRIYPNEAPQEAARPYAVYARVGDEIESHAGGVGGLSSTMIQVTVWADTYPGAKSASKAIIDAVIGFKGKMPGETGVDVDAVFVTERMDVYEPERRRHGVDFDLRIWHRGD